MRACILHEEETKGLVAREEDAALCEVAAPEGATEGQAARYCWACITTPANVPGALFWVHIVEIAPDPE